MNTIDRNDAALSTELVTHQATSVAESCAAIAKVLRVERDDIWTSVQREMTQVLRMTSSNISPTASLVEELGCDSLDIVELVGRLEESCGVKLNPSAFHEVLVGAGMVTADGVITADAREQIRQLMPEVETHRLEHVTHVSEISSLWTPESLVRLVAFHKARIGR